MRKTFLQFITTISLTLLLCLTFSCQKQVEEATIKSLWNEELEQTKIAFASERDGNGEIYVMNADGSEITRLTNNSAADLGPSWSPFLKKET